ncbi:hypothetical protein [Alkalinema sp. FACHB-956]|uniref:hypothetical protein n=1 Tax=Alkalinema sp. FACHB-956 TaxID=2692768 RepID=UPI001689AB82|nr:hypothetical protein [Alkalinema sp. FACHB-956]MBD2326729.1 hypothetical protein [Alkalinema sp. FACHB-956]
MQITLDIPEALQQNLLSQAAQTQTTLEQLIIQVLDQYLQPAKSDNATDQLLSLIGTLDLGTTDLAERHDQYIGEALYRELHHAE